MESVEMYKAEIGGCDYPVPQLLDGLSWGGHFKYKGILICDVDGCIRSGKHRVGLLPTSEDIELAGDKPNIAFTKFNEMCHLDEPIHPVINLVRMFREQDYFIIILTSCTHSDHTRTTLMSQLLQWDIPHDAVVMRGRDNHRWPTSFKEMFLHDAGIVDYNGSVVALDDCNSNCNVFRKHGILSLQTADYSRFNIGDKE